MLLVEVADERKSDSATVYLCEVSVLLEQWGCNEGSVVCSISC